MKISDKTNDEIKDILLNTTSFESAKSMCDILGIEYSYRQSTIFKKLSHFCKWHKEGKTSIVIDEVFDNVGEYKSIYDYFYNINDIVKTNKGEVQIVKCYMDGKFKSYECKCIKHNYLFHIRQYNLKRGCGCPICSNCRPITDFNSAYVLHPEIIKYVVNKEVLKTIKSGSNKKILCKCPNCDSTRLIIIGNLIRYGFSCHVCSSGISYPNKFIRYLLNQFDIEYMAEKSFKWSDRKIYDVYIPKYNCIIEMQGEQHYVEIKHWGSLKDVKSNDKYKRKLALSNNIDNYFEINCKDSSFEYIKKSIIDSGLLEFLNIDENEVNWKLIDEKSHEPIIKTACELCNDGYKPIEIASKLDIDYTTVLKYLKKGNKLGWCNYLPKENLGCSKASRDARSKPIYCPEYDIYFYNATDCSNYFKENIDQSFKIGTLRECLVTRNKYKNNHFYYIDKDVYNLKKKEYEEFENINHKVIGEYYTNLIN